MGTSSSRWLLVICAQVVLGAVFAAGCAPEEPALVDDEGAMGGSDSGESPPRGAITDRTCDADSECEDGAFCNGAESCFEGRCYTGLPPNCDDGIDCTLDACSHTSNSCAFSAPDEDGDGFTDSGCLGPAGEPLGSDCDDEDSSRFPGNLEVCSPSEPGHDEDCDPTTFGYLDHDLDGVVSSTCCNTDAEGSDLCGADCDDDSFRRYPEHPEICDDIDNDCDGLVDVNTKQVPWYPDLDGDNYGQSGAEGQLSCFPVEGYSLRGTDCDDTTAATHSAALEVCDGVDNDCDGQTDEDAVCACAPDGNARACACDETATGVQLCQGGLWGSCDCRQCVEGTRDCLGDLLPRECENGRWVVENSCKGNKPICLEGECACADGTQSCQDLPDVFPPHVQATAPSDLSENVDPDAVFAVEFSEPMSPLSFSVGSLSVKDTLGNSVPGAISVGGVVAHFVPTNPLNPGMDYTFAVENSVTDLSGNHLSQAQVVTFTTAPSAVSFNAAFGESASYLEPQLALSPSGKAMMLVRKNDLTSGTPVPVGFITLTLNGGQWDEGPPLFTSTVTSALCIDDQGYAMVLHKPGTKVSRYDFLGTAWSPEQSISDSDDSNAGPVCASSGSGFAFSALVVSDQLRVIPREPSGSYLAATNTPTTQPLALRDAAVNSLGAGAVASVGTGPDVDIYLSGAGLTGWAHFTKSVNETVKELSVVMNESGTATVAWQMSQGGYAQIFVQDIHPTLGFTGPIDEPTPGGSSREEVIPKLGVDKDGVLHLLYSVAGELKTMRRSVDGTWSGEEALSLPGSTTQHALAVSYGGDAVAVWLQKAGTSSAQSLVGARYEKGIGWSAPEILESSSRPISNFDVKIDAAGQALVAYEEGTVWWRYF